MENVLKPGKINPTTIQRNFFEKEAWQRESFICGIDEVGRGCLAGPLVTAAVILPIGKTTRLIKDSKVLTPQARQEAFLWIKKHCWYNIGIVHNRIIDKHNIWHATLIAMKKAVIHLLSTCPHLPSSIVIDAMPLNLYNTAYTHIPIYHFTGGEDKSISIAAASIVAKVYRDELMHKFHPLFPHYLLHNHKGYATPAHQKAVRTSRASIIHRTNFISHLIP